MIDTRQITILIAALVVAVILLPFPDDPGNAYGMALGIAGTALMVAMHGYTLRKNQTIGSGSVPSWLSIHMVFGLVGPALIVLHSRLSFRGIAGFAALIMLAEAISGLTGRYIYMQIPRTKRGQVKSLEEIEQEEAELTERLREELPEEGEELLDLAGGNVSQDTGLLTLLIRDLRDRVTWPIRIRRAPKEKRPGLRRARELAMERNKLRRNIAALDTFMAYLENWRTVHIPVASVFLLLIAVHVVVVFYY